MAKKTLAALALAVMMMFALPTAAHAGYGDDLTIGATGSFVPGGSVTVTVGGFEDAENVRFAVTGEGAVTIGVLQAIQTATVAKVADANGVASATVGLPSNATGSYNVTATGEISGIVSGVITVAPADTAGSSTGGGGLAQTGGTGVPMLAIWTAGGVLLLGVALVVVMNVVRRQRVSA